MRGARKPIFLHGIATPLAVQQQLLALAGVRGVWPDLRRRCVCGEGSGVGTELTVQERTTTPPSSSCAFRLLPPHVSSSGGAGDRDLHPQPLESKSTVAAECVWDSHGNLVELGFLKICLWRGPKGCPHSWERIAGSPVPST